MKKLIIVALFLAISLLVACSSDAGGSNALTADDALKAFEDAGLEVVNARAMTKDDYGMAPMKAKEGKMFTVPSVCDDCNVRVMSFEKDSELKETKDFYDDLGKESAMLFSWTIGHKNILIQLNGDMVEEDYEKYKEALEGL